MDTFTYKGISDGKYVEGNIEALNSDEASHKLKEQKIIITNLIRAAQRLARKNCKKCKIPDDDVNPKVLQDLGFSAEQASRVKAIKGKGCETCSNTGYKGRQGIYEILVVSKPLKEAILRKATTPELRQIAVKEGFQTMQDMGKRLIASGDLNFREYERVLSNE